MTAYVALVRGLGGAMKRIIPMKDLARIVEKAGGRDVKTYIASGNVVFRAGKLDTEKFGAKITAGIEKARGFAPWVLVLTLVQLEKALAANPYPDADAAPASLHVDFLAEKPKKPDLTPMERALKSSERYALKGKVFYFYAPDGVGKSDAFRKIEKVIGVGTARNWRTCCTLRDMARAAGRAGIRPARARLSRRSFRV